MSDAWRTYDYAYEQGDGVLKSAYKGSRLSIENVNNVDDAMTFIKTMDKVKGVHQAKRVLTGMLPHAKDAAARKDIQKQIDAASKYAATGLPETTDGLKNADKHFLAYKGKA